MPEIYFEDFRIGDVAEYGPYLVTAEEIKAFAAEFDPQPMHLDEQAARATMIGGLCASGYHTCSIANRMIADGFLLKSSAIGSLGVDEVRWMAPVKPGDRLMVRARVLDARVCRDRPEVGRIDFLFETINHTGVTAMTMTTSMMFRQRNGGAA